MDQKELAALDSIYTLLLDFDAAAQGRMLRWLTEKVRDDAVKADHADQQSAGSLQDSVPAAKPER